MTAGRRPGGREVTAARENAEWVDLFCRSHGVVGELGDRVWRSPRRTPPFYPDAVTHPPQATESDVVGGIDRTVGACDKDSFAVLDLTRWGSGRRFDARWLWRDADAPAPPATPAARRVTWQAVTTPAGVSNSFGHDLPSADVWLSYLPSVLEAAAGRPLVGYLREDAADAAVGAAFEVLGPLTVWVRGDDA